MEGHPMPVNILIMIHGMTPDLEPLDLTQTYDKFWEALIQRKRGLPDLIDKKISIQWGHERPGSTSPLRDDEKLTHAQQFTHDQVSYDAVRADSSPNNILMTGFFGRDWGIPFLRGVSMSLRESIILCGLGDVAYYISPEGEKQVRKVVYQQALCELDEYLDEDDVRFHFFGHSLGVTLIHDFLYGLFAPDRIPDFVRDKQGDPESCQRYEKWRVKAQDGTLKLGSLASAASQIPIFMMRKQELVDRLFNERPLDPSVLGINAADRIQWTNFYDIAMYSVFPQEDCTRQTPP